MLRRIESMPTILRRFGMPLFAAAIALALVSFLRPVLPDIIFLPLLVAVVIGTWYGERIGGVLALMLGVLGSVFLHFPPFYSVRLADPRDGMRLAIFVLVA